MPQPTEKLLAECYQPLFDLMDKEHGKILTVSEMDEIIEASFKVKDAVDKLFNEVTSEN